MNKKTKKAVKEVAVVIVICLISVVFGYYFYDNAMLFVHENAHKFVSEKFRGLNCTIINFYPALDGSIKGATYCENYSNVRGIALEGIFAELLVGLLIMISPLSAFALLWFFMMAYKVIFIHNTDFTGVPYVFNIIFGVILLGLLYLSMELQRWWLKKLRIYKLLNIM